jgi:hypothetical protein
MTKGYWIPQGEPGEPAKPAEPIEPIEPVAPKPSIKGRKLYRLCKFPDGTQHRVEIPAEPPKPKSGGTMAEMALHYHNLVLWTQAQWEIEQTLQRKSASTRKDAKKALLAMLWGFRDGIEPSQRTFLRGTAKILSHIDELRREVEKVVKKEPPAGDDKQGQIEIYIYRILKRGRP